MDESSDKAEDKNEAKQVEEAKAQKKKHKKKKPKFLRHKPKMTPEEREKYRILKTQYNLRELSVEVVPLSKQKLALIKRRDEIKEILAMAIEREHQEQLKIKEQQIAYFREEYEKLKARNPVFYCEYCPKSFKEEEDCERHINVVHLGILPFPCPHCKAPFDYMKDLNEHVKTTHPGETEKQKAIDDFEFKKPYPVKKTRQKPEMKLTCNVCGYECAYKSKLEEHMRKHTDERRAACQICGKKFRRLSQLTVHLVTHSQDRPFVCISCGKGFRIKRELQHHVKQVHRFYQNYIKCQFCPRLFCTQKNLDVHMNNSHPTEKSANKKQTRSETATSASAAVGSAEELAAAYAVEEPAMEAEEAAIPSADEAATAATEAAATPAMTLEAAIPT